MKKFFEDYKELCKHSGRFYKDHWLGTAIVTAVGLGLSLAPVAILRIKENRELKKLENSYIQHNDPDNVLGHALLENRGDGVYAYCKFNDSEAGKTAKLLVEHGDVNALSIWKEVNEEDTDF